MYLFQVKIVSDTNCCTSKFEIVCRVKELVSDRPKEKIENVGIYK
jgi:hypothetical protein